MRCSVCEGFEELSLLVERLKRAQTDEEKLKILEKESRLRAFFKQKTILYEFYQRVPISYQLLIASIVAIGEEGTVFESLGSLRGSAEKIDRLLGRLSELEQFYREMGGIVGYHYAVLQLLDENKKSMSEATRGKTDMWCPPPYLDLTEKGQSINQQIRWGIEALPEMAELYAVGGAGDRLGLKSSETGEPLPAALLPFLGKTLLELLIQDLQAREYLYYKLTGGQITTPVLMMTSEEKNNDTHIKAICEANTWFGRSEDSFFFFKQPLVPVTTCEGHWSLSGPLELYLKPGGHGVIWKLARDSGGFAWLEKKNRTKALIRQINNPIANTDYGLLAFPGIGWKMKKTFGFSSCPRLLGAAEGTLVLVHKEVGEKHEYTISNVEYTEFSKRGLEDTPQSSGSSYSQFPANTNILFVDIEKIQKILEKNPLPGQILNCKNDVPTVDPNGVLLQKKGGRLESTMQNISDFIHTELNHILRETEVLALDTYVTYNERRKTISVAKNAYHSEKRIQETAEGCFYEMMHNHHALLSRECAMELPPFSSESSYLSQGPNVIFSFHPALGPLYSVISQKCRGGRLHEGAELVLEIAELEMKNVDIEGSLIIKAQHLLGGIQDGKFIYGEGTGKCRLIDVKVRNQGIDRSKKNVYWKNEVERKDALQIFLNGNGEFEAEGITFSGDYLIEVPDGYRYRMVEKAGELFLEKRRIAEPTWFWSYRFNASDEIELFKK